MKAAFLIAWIVALSVQAHTWTFSQDGKLIVAGSGEMSFKKHGRIDGDFVRSDGTNVVIAIDDGKEGTVALANLSNDDKAYVQKMVWAQAKPAAQTPQQEPEVKKSPEEKLLALFPELLWKKSDLVEKGWAKPGQNVRLKSSYFAKRNYSFNDTTGEMQFLAEGERVINVAYYVESEGEFSKLRQLLVGVCGSDGEMNKDHSKTHWTVLGTSNKYCLDWVQREFGRDVERSLEAYVMGLSASCP